MRPFFISVCSPYSEFAPAFKSNNSIPKIEFAMMAAFVSAGVMRGPRTARYSTTSAMKIPHRHSAAKSIPFIELVLPHDRNNAMPVPTRIGIAKYMHNVVRRWTAPKNRKSVRDASSRSDVSIAPVVEPFMRGNIIHVSMNIPPSQTSMAVSWSMVMRGSIIGICPSLSYPMRSLISSSTVEIPSRPNDWRMTPSTAGDRKPGKVGPM